jgi:excisionase family DNA binding protein
MTTEPWVGVDEVTAHLDIKRDTLYRWISRRGLPGSKVGKVWRFRLSEVDDWMRSQREHDEDDSAGRSG